MDTQEGKENGDGNGGDLMDEAFPKQPQKLPQVPPKPTYPHQEAIKQLVIFLFLKFEKCFVKNLVAGFKLNLNSYV